MCLLYGLDDQNKTIGEKLIPLLIHTEVHGPHDMYNYDILHVCIL
jgi:hypothetical protein